MGLTYRAATKEDGAEFYEACFHDNRHDQALKQTVLWEWNVLVQHPATLTIVVEDSRRALGSRLVTYTQLAFITAAFVQRAREGKERWVNVLAASGRRMADHLFSP